MRLSKLLENLSEREIVYSGKHWEREITELSFDSRRIKQGALFFCLTGGNADGHDFARFAVKNGAVAVVVEKPLYALPVSVPQIVVENSRKALSKISSRFYGEPCEHLRVIGITGTNGKTTTAHMLASILQASGKKTGVIGTLGAKYDGREYPCDLTTPDPIALHKLFADMFLSGVEYVVMEVSAHALHYYKTDGIFFTACIFTNCTQDHLDFFSDMESYKSAKKRLFSNENCPLAILNGDDETGRKWGEERLLTATEKEKTYFYGITEPADAFAVVTNERLNGSEFVLNVNDEICRVSLSMTGRHNVYNALAAATCAIALGVEILWVEKGLNALKVVKGRLERVSTYQGAEIFVDFAHTPDGLEKSLSALERHCKGRLICLFGCGGNRDKGKRPIMGQTVAKKCAFAVLTSDNPRYEDPLDILSDIERGYRRFSGKYVIVPNRERAIEYAIEHLREGDVLLVAGKGGERYQEIMGIKYEFNDNDIIEKIVKNKEKTTV